MRKQHFLSRSGQRHFPLQKFINQGLFKIEAGTYCGQDGKPHVYVITKVTGKGQIYFVNRFLDNQKEEENSLIYGK